MFDIGAPELIVFAILLAVILGLVVTALISTVSKHT